MGKTFICEVSDEETRKIMNIFEMKNTLESLAMQIAGNNDIIKEDSLLYTKLVEDYRQVMRDYNNFWSPYLIKYKDYIDGGMELSIDFGTSILFATPKNTVS